jgi:hypothetical protein
MSPSLGGRAARALPQLAAVGLTILLADPVVAESPPDTWYTVPALKAADPATRRAGKHSRAAWDSKRARFLITAGDRDGSDIGQPNVKALDPDTGRTTLLSPTCPPEPAYMPHFPDNVGWTYDAKRDEFLMFRGFYGTSYKVAAKVCKRSDDRVLATDVIFNPQSNEWAPHTWPVSPVGYGNDSSGPSHAVYDADTDSVYLYKKSGAWGGTLLILDRAANEWRRVLMGQQTRGSQRSAVKNSNCYRSHPAILDGWIYCVSSRGKNSALVRVSLANPSKAEAFPMPAGFKGTADDVENWLVAHSSAKVLLYPYFRGLTSPVLALHIWDSAAKEWETREIPSPPEVKEAVTGGTVTFNPQTEELVICCRALKGFDGYLTWRYRYSKRARP